MTRTYELGFVVEPRQNDDEVQAITDRFTNMIEEAGSEITYIDNWGKRKLAYPIRKFNEGRYVFVYVSSDGEPPPWSTIERLMLQDEKILRHLVVRTDHDLKRAFRKGKVKPEIPGAEKEEEAAAEAASAEEVASEEKAAEETAAETSTEETAAASEEPAAEAASEEPAAEAASEEPAAEAASEEPAAEEGDTAEAAAEASTDEDKGGEE